jgi:hypothetical protein
MLQCSKQKPSGERFWSFEFGTLGFASDFVLRISDFRLLCKRQETPSLRFENRGSALRFDH